MQRQGWLKRRPWMCYGSAAFLALTAVPDYANARQATGPVWTVTAPAENPTSPTVVHTTSTYSGADNTVIVTYCWAAGTYAAGTEPTDFTMAVIEGVAPNDVPYPVTFTTTTQYVAHGTDTCLELKGTPTSNPPVVPKFTVGYNNIQGTRQGRLRIHPSRGKTLWLM